MTSEEVRFDSRQRHETFFVFYTTARRALEQNSRSVKLLTHFYPEQTLRMSGNIPTRDDIAYFIFVHRNNFTSGSFLENAVAREEV